MRTAEIVASGAVGRNRKLLILAHRIKLGLDNPAMLAILGVIGVFEWYALEELMGVQFKPFSNKELETWL
jgi:hypothetical protein